MEVEPSKQQEGRFKLKEWNAVVMWSWNTDVDTCAICRSKLMTLCIDCQAKVNSGEKGDCQVVFDNTLQSSDRIAANACEFDSPLTRSG